MIKREVIKGLPIRKEPILIQGKNELRDVYKVNINSLYFNDENGRIATFISEYRANTNTQINDLDFDDYNDLIMDYIKKSGSSDKYKTTKNSIKSVGQMRVGIILEDGRVIDGNRRFTCLRELYKETLEEKYSYFECFILPVPENDEDRKMIKTLELNYQFGEDSKEDYNPIDRLADAYKDLVSDQKLFTPEEYNSRVNNQMKLTDIKLMMLKAQTLYDYLLHINKKERWDIARDYKLDGPIQEISSKRKKIGEMSEEWFRVAPAIYTQLQNICNDPTKGDKTREIRKFLKIYDESPKEFNQAVDALFDISMKKEMLKSIDDKEKREQVEISIKKDISDLSRKVESTYTEIGLEKARDKQLKQLRDIEKKFIDIDHTAIKLSSNDMLDELDEELNVIDKKITILRNVIENARKKQF